MVLPAYIDADTGAITDGEAWIAVDSAEPSSANVEFLTTNDGQVGDWSQYMDLVIIMYAAGAASGATGYASMRLNADNGSNYAYQYLNGSGSAVYPSASTTTFMNVLGDMPCTGSSNMFGVSIIHFFDINSGKYKNINYHTGADRDGSGQQQNYATTWLNQSPIDEIDIETASGFAAGTRIDLFGILPRMVNP